MTLQKEDFVDRFAQKGYTKRDSRIIVTDFINTIMEIMADSDSVMFRGFGVFNVKEHKEREGVSPKDGKRILIKGYKSPHFTPGKILKRAVKEGFVREN